MSRQDEIATQAKEILDSFYAQLQGLELSESIGVKRDVQTRQPKIEIRPKEFKQKILANAPNKDQDYIVAEKKTW